MTPKPDWDALRALFVGAEEPLVYFDGNSLGRPLAATAERMATFVERAWGERLIRGWDDGWFEEPLTLGDALAEVVLGGAPGQTAIGDSTSVWLYKLIRAATDAKLAEDPQRTHIVIDRDNFPTDRYLVEGIAAERGMAVRWITAEPDAGVDVDTLSAALDERVALVLLSHVAYRSAYLADAAALTAATHDAGAMLVLDLSHSAGCVPVELDAWGVDLAVGCTYKYLNGGPGAPAFAYVASRHQDTLRQPIQGWMGHADPFLMGQGYVPANGMRRFLSGTPPIIGMLALHDMLALIGRIGLPAIRERSVELTEVTVALGESLLAPLGARLASPRDPLRRGGHVTFNHPAMREVTAALWRTDVLPDYRDPDGLRIGLSPLSTSVNEVERGLVAVRDALVATAA